VKNRYHQIANHLKKKKSPQTPVVVTDGAKIWTQQVQVGGFLYYWEEERGLVFISWTSRQEREAL